MEASMDKECSITVHSNGHVTMSKGKRVIDRALVSNTKESGIQHPAKHYSSSKIKTLADMGSMI